MASAYRVLVDLGSRGLVTYQTYRKPWLGAQVQATYGSYKPEPVQGTVVYVYPLMSDANRLMDRCECGGQLIRVDGHAAVPAYWGECKEATLV